MQEKMKLNIQLFAVSTELTCETLSQDAVSDTSNIKIIFTVRRTSGTTFWTNPVRVTFTVDGQTLSSSLSLPSNMTSNSCYVLATVKHNEAGEKTLQASAISDNTGTSAGRISASGEFTLPIIPRYAVITKYELNAVDEKTISIRVGTDVPCDAIEYSLNNGNWQGLSLDGLIGQLNVNTLYNVKIRVKRTDSQLWTESQTKQVTTYDYPHALSMPPFNISDELSITIYNPLKRVADVYLILADGTNVFYGTINDDSTLTGFNTEDWVQALYSSIPNNRYGQYKVRIVYGDIYTYEQNASNYYALEEYCLPIVQNYQIKDINPDTLAITHDENIIVAFSSIVNTVVYFQTINYAKAIELYYGETSVSVEELSSENGTTNYKAEFNFPSEDLYRNIIAFDVKDTRNFTKRYDIVIENFVEYSSLSFSLSAYNLTSPSQDTVSISFNGLFYSGNINQTPNELTIKYRVKEKNGEYSEYREITEYSLVGENIVKNIYSGINVEEKTDIILLNPLSQDGKWDYNKEYEIEVITSDLLTIIPNILPVPKGLPIFYWAEIDGLNLVEVIGKLKSGTVDIFSELRVGETEYNDGKIFLNGKEIIGSPDLIENEYFTGRYWKNGKPIYAQVVAFETTSQTQTIKEMPYVDEVIEIYGTCSMIGGNTLPVNFHYQDNGLIYYIRTWFYDKKIYNISYGYTNYAGNVIIEYTKE